MTTWTPSLSPQEILPLGPSLAEVLSRLPDLALQPQARKNLASAIRTLARVLGRDPALVPIAAPVFRRLVEQASPGACGVTPTRWRNVKSDARRAIELSGLGAAPLPKLPLSAAWERLALLAPDKTRRAILRRFGRFCSSCQLEPAGVDPATLQRYRDYLDQNQLSKTPERTIKDLVRAWNRFAVPAGFPVLPSQNASRCYTPGWEALPAGLAAEAARFKAESLKPDPFNRDAFAAPRRLRPVKAATAAQYDRMLRRLAAAAMQGGVPFAALDSLAALVQPDHLKAGLQVFLDRAGGKTNRQLFDMAQLALKVARHWVRLPESDLATIAGWAKNLQPPRAGMTEKNRERLRQFGERAVIQRLLALPEQMIATARQRPRDSRAAKQVQIALAIALLSVAPLRLGNLRALDRERHFKRAFSVENPNLQLVIPREEVKNRVDLRFPVPAPLRAMLELYMEIYQPLLAKGYPSRLLFPGRTGGALTDSALRRNITKALREEAGLQMHPHLFRHFAALLYLTEHPGHYEPVRQLLGHKSLQTTIDFYAGFQNDQAMELYGQVLEQLREAPEPQPPKPRRRR